MPSAAPRRVVLAPDKFKGTLSAPEVAEAMASGLSNRSDLDVYQVPIADGGDGSVEAAVSAGWDSVTLRTVGAWGAPLDVEVAVRKNAAIVEVASICGLGSRRPTARESVTASSKGVGVVLLELATSGIADVTLALGGSATTDAGIGMLRALGLALRDSAGRPLGDNSLALADVAEVDMSGMDAVARPPRLTLACDVDTPMVGPDGSAEMFAAQKGADPDTVRGLSRALGHVSHVLGPAFGSARAHERPGSGAAGGLAWACLLLGGHVRAGSEVFMELLEAETRVRGADLVVTGEGRLDAQSLRGKAPVAVAHLAQRHDVPAVAVVGSTILALDAGPFIDVVSIDRIDARCIDDAGLTRSLVARETAKLLDRHLPDLTSANGASR